MLKKTRLNRYKLNFPIPAEPLQIKVSFTNERFIVQSPCGASIVYYIDCRPSICGIRNTFDAS